MSRHSCDPGPRRGSSDASRLEVADIFRDHGSAWRDANRGHVNLDQLKAMGAIERCRTAALGGHVARCENAACGHTTIAYNSCRNRHCPKCQGRAAHEWMAAREAELLPVNYFHVVFTLPTAIAEIAYQNKAVIYDLLFKASAETMRIIAADPKHLGAKIGVISVLHTWGSAMMYHPHVHMIVPGGGLSIARGEDGECPTGNGTSERWITCRKGFFLPVRVLAKLFRRLMLDKLIAAHDAGKINFHGRIAHLAETRALKRFLKPTRRRKWYVYAKRPFAGPKAVLAYLSRYTHRVAISNRRLIRADAQTVTFKVKDYRLKGRRRHTLMTLATPEFIRRFLIHVLPKGLHRIRHYGLFANTVRATNLARMRTLLGVDEALTDDPEKDATEASCEPEIVIQPCPCCGGAMRIIEVFDPGCAPRTIAMPEGIDSS